jgi:YD repeat-containing protein
VLALSTGFAFQQLLEYILHRPIANFEWRCGLPKLPRLPKLIIIEAAIQERNPWETARSKWRGFNHLLTMTDPLNHTTTFSYDAAGGLSSITDPLG